MIELLDENSNRIFDNREVLFLTIANLNINVNVNSNINVTTNSNSFVKSTSSFVDSKINNVDIDNDDDEKKKMSTNVANIISKK